MVEVMDEKEVQDFWQDHACGDALVGGLKERFGGDCEKFFADYDQFRYSVERYLPGCFDALQVNRKRVLEIGLGQGADSESLIRRGAVWSGIDLTDESVERVRARLTLRELPFEELRQGSALDLPFAKDTFVVYLLARAGIPLPRVGGMLSGHLDNVRKYGLGNYLRLNKSTHYNTDGPVNPYSLVYDRRRIEQNFPSFRVTRTYKRFMHAPPLPVHGLPGQAVMGWHFWAHLEPIENGAPR